MKLYRIYEAARSVNDLQREGWQVILDETTGHAKFNITRTDAPSESLGHVMLKRVRVTNYNSGRKDSLWLITLIESGKLIPGSATPFKMVGGKSGPLLYDLAIEHATKNGAGLLPAEALTMVISRLFGAPHKRGSGPERAKSDGFYFTKPGHEPYNDRGNPNPNGLLNFTSADARNIYQRLFDTGRGLTSKVTTIDISNYIDRTILGFCVQSLQNVHDVDFKDFHAAINMHKDGETIEPKFMEILDEAGRDGWDGNGWPCTKRMAEDRLNKWIKQNQCLATIYRKEPVTTAELERLGLLLRQPYE